MQKSPRAFRLRPQLKRPLAVASGGLTLGSRARFCPALCYVRREVETAREATCPKVRDMENEVRRARRTSAPFGWKASGLQALPAGLFFCFFGASGLPVSSGCGGIPPKCVRMQVRSTRPCSAVGRYIPLHEASCVRRAGRRSGAVGSSVTEGPMTKQHREALQVQSMHQEGEAALRRLQEHDFGLQENDCRPCFWPRRGACNEMQESCGAFFAQSHAGRLLQRRFKGLFRDARSVSFRPLVTSPGKFETDGGRDSAHGRHGERRSNA